MVLLRTQKLCFNRWARKYSQFSYFSTKTYVVGIHYFSTKIYVAGTQKNHLDQTNKILFLNQNICCGYSKEPSQWDVSFEHLKQMFKLMDKKLFTILQSNILLCWTKQNFLFLNQNICCGYSKEPSRWGGSFEHPKQMFKLMDKKIFTNLHLSGLVLSFLPLPLGVPLEFLSVSSHTCPFCWQSLYISCPRHRTRHGCCWHACCPWQQTHQPMTAAVWHSPCSPK